MIKAKIVGAGGYGGVGISELLLEHPDAEIAALVDVEGVGTPISDIYPHLAGFIDTPIIHPTDAKAMEPADVVFKATPDRVGMKLAVDKLAGHQHVCEIERELGLLAAYMEFFKDDLFVRIYDSTATIGTIHVSGTNYCNLTVSVDARTNRLRVVSHIDNLMKGQAGSAL